MNREHGIAESVEFRLGFTFGWFYHQGAGHGPAHSGGVVAVIDQAFGDVFDGDAAGFLERADIKYAFVGHGAGGSGEEGGEGPGETAGDIIGIEDGVASGFGEAWASH